MQKQFMQMLTISLLFYCVVDPQLLHTTLIFILIVYKSVMRVEHFTLYSSRKIFRISIMSNRNNYEINKLLFIDVIFYWQNCKKRDIGNNFAMVLIGLSSVRLVIEVNQIISCMILSIRRLRKCRRMSIMEFHRILLHFVLQEKRNF